MHLFIRLTVNVYGLNFEHQSHQSNSQNTTKQVLKNINWEFYEIHFKFFVEYLLKLLSYLLSSISRRL